MVTRIHPGENGEPARAKLGEDSPKGFASVAIAAEQVRADFRRFLDARGAGIASRARKLLLTAVLYAALALVAVVALSSALVLLLVGSARALALALGISESLGFMLVGGSILATAFTLLARRRRSRRARLDEADRDARGDLAASSATLARELARPAGLLAAGIVGFGGIHALRVPAVRSFSALLVRGSRTCLLYTSRCV